MAKNVLYNLVGQALVLVVGLVAVRYVFVRLGSEALGIIYLASTLSALLCAVAELGMTTTVVREVAVYREREPEYVRELVGTVSLFCWAAAIGAGLLLYFAAPYVLNHVVKLKSLHAEVALPALRVLFFGGLLALPRSLYLALLRGVQRMEFGNAIDVGMVGSQQAGVVLILARGGSLRAVANWLAICFVLATIAYLVAAARFVPLQALLPAYSSRAVKRNVGFSTRMASCSLLSFIHAQAARILATKLLPLGEFGLFAFAFSSVSRATVVSESVSQASFPELSEINAGSDHGSFERACWKLHEVIAIAAAPFFAAITFAVVPLFARVFDSGVAQLMQLPVALLCAGFFLNASLTVPYVASVAVGKPGIMARANLYGLFVLLPLTAYLMYRYGVTGAAASWLLYPLFHYLYTVPRICAQCLRVPVWAWYRHTLRILIVPVLTFGIGYAAAQFAGPSVLVLAVCFAASGAVFLAITYRTMTEALRTQLLRAGRQVRIRMVEAW